APLLVALGQTDGQLEPYGGLGGKVLVFEEGDVLLLVDDPSLELERAAPPVGDRGVWRARAHWGRRPLAQEDGRPGVVPAQAAVGEARLRSPNGLADGEEDVVRRHLEVAPRHPDLQQPRVRVDERGASEPADHRRRERMPQIEEQIGLGGSFEIHRVIGNSAREGSAVQREERERFREAVRLQVELERRDFFPGVKLGVARVDPFEPDHPTPQRSQTEGPLEIDRQVPAALRIRDRTSRGEADCRAHDGPPVAIRSATDRDAEYPSPPIRARAWAGWAW